MRKLFCFSLIMIIIISMCGCVSNSEFEEVNKELEVLTAELNTLKKELDDYKQYDILLENIKNGDYDAAIVGIQSMMPKPEPPVYTEISITMDNWDTYFDINYEEIWNTDIFGDALDMNCYYILRLKEPYFNRITNLDNTVISVKWSSILRTYPCSTDLENKTYTITDDYVNNSGEEKSPVTDSNTFDGNDLINSQEIKTPLAVGILVPDYAISKPENFELLRIQGSIFLTNE